MFAFRWKSGLVHVVNKVAVVVGALSIVASAVGAAELPGWGMPIDTDGDCSFEATGDSLTIVAPGPTHGLSAELNRMNAPRVLRKVSGDFIVELRVDTEFDPGEKTLAARTAYQGSGLLLMKDDRTYIRIESAVLVRNGRPRFYTNFELRVDGRLQRFGAPGDFDLDGSRPVWLRLERRGDQILGAVTQDAGQWQYLPAKETPFPPELLLGTAAINASSHPLVAKFAALRVFQQYQPRAETHAVVQARGLVPANCSPFSHPPRRHFVRRRRCFRR